MQSKSQRFKATKKTQPDSTPLKQEDWVESNTMSKDAYKAGFHSTEPRFRFKEIFYGENLKMTPGPGYYTNKLSKKRSHKGKGFGKDRKFSQVSHSHVATSRSI